MFSFERFKNRYSFPNVAGLCPNCHRTDPIGHIEIKVNVVFDSMATPSNTRIHAPSAMNSCHDTMGTRRLINVYCPECQTRMLIVDGQIAKPLARFNKAGFFTQYSCYGHSDSGHSMVPYLQLYDIEIVNIFNDWLISRGWVNHRSLDDEYYAIKPTNKLYNHLDHVTDINMGYDVCTTIPNLPQLKYVKFPETTSGIYPVKDATKEAFWNGLEAWIILVEILWEKFDRYMRSNDESVTDIMQQCYEQFLKCRNQSLAQLMEAEACGDRELQKFGRGKTDVEQDEQ